MIRQASGLCRCFPLQCTVLPAQVVVALEKLGLRLQRGAALGETPRLPMQRYDVLADCPVQAFQQRGRDLFERNQLLDAEDDSSGDGHQSPPFALLDDLAVAHAWVGYDLWVFRAATSLALDEVDQDGEDNRQREQVRLPPVTGPQRPTIESQTLGRPLD
jgi:hypothetical protein